jgi:phospholipid/cholesterol/gamma-HCH transport system ATP-binding protein
MGMLFRRHLVMFGPREVLLTSDEPVVKQFLNGRRIGPIGMSEEKDEATMAEEQGHLEAGHVDGGVEEVEGVPPQIIATPGMPERKAVGRRQARVRENLHLLPTDPLAQMPLIDFDPPAMPVPQPIWPSQSAASEAPSCTVICIG